MHAKYSFYEAKQKIEAFCAYQERCEYEVIKKLHSWLISEDDTNTLIADLISNNFLNEERFAEAFVSGKFRIKRWGRIKIRQHLKQKRISEYSIKKGMEIIDEREYTDTLKELALAKNRLLSAKDEWDRKVKLQRYLSTKGYEQEYVLKIVEQILTA